MKFSRKARTLINSFPQEERGIVETFLYAKKKGFPLDYFPIQVEMPKSQISTETIDKEFLTQWVAKWPTPSQMRRDGANVGYSVSGNMPTCRKRFQQFLSQWDDFVSENSDPYDLINRATDLYLERQRENGWAMTKKNFKFILDVNGSVLSQMIEELGEPMGSSNFYI